MAARNIEVIIKVRDNASKRLNELEKKVKGTGKAAKRASVDFKDFNRTLFATTAFVGTFIKTFSALGNSLNLGAELDRVDNQFERVLGPSGSMLINIRTMTDAAVDSMEAMKAGIALSNSGITQTSQDTARLIAMSAAAARRAGLDTTEGIKRVTQFAKSGSVASLEFLNLVRTTDPAFTAQIELIKQVGGALGGTLSMQQKYAIGMRALELATRGNMKGQRDLQDVLKGVQDSWSILRRTIGRFLGSALSPLIDKMTDFFYKMSLGLENLRDGNKEILFLAKATVVATGSVLGLAGALGTLRLATYALSSLGFGLPKLLFLTGAITTAFIGLTSNADSLADKFKVFGGFLRGIFQLVSTFDTKTGISKIDSKLKKLLKDNEIYEFAKLIARGAVLAKTALEDVVAVVKSIATSVDNMFGGMFRSLINLASKFNEPWDLALLSLEKRTVRLIGLFGAIAGGFAIKKLIGGVLSKIPVIGGLFGGKGPKGTATDPIFTVPVGGGLGGLIGGRGGKIGGLLGKVLSPLKNFLSIMFKNLPFRLGKAAGTGIRLLFTTVIGKLLAALGLGALVGTGVNKLADAYTTQENQYGQKSNVFERGIGKLATFLPESMGGISDDQYKEMYGPGAGSGEKTSVVNMPKPDRTMEHLDSIGARMQELDKAERGKLQSATEAALKAGAEGTGVITDDEMRKLTGSFGVALDNSRLLGNIEENTRRTTPGPANRRGE